MNLVLLTYQQGLSMSLRDRFDLSAQTNGLVLAYLSFMGALARAFVLPALSAGCADSRLVAVAFASLSIAYTGTSLAPDLTSWLVIHAAVELASGVVKTVLTGAATKVTRSVDLGVGAVLGFLSSVTNVCRIVAPLISGLLLSHMGCCVVDAVVAGACLVLCLITVVLWPPPVSIASSPASQRCASPNAKQLKVL